MKTYHQITPKTVMEQTLIQFTLDVPSCDFSLSLGALSIRGMGDHGFPHTSVFCSS